MYKAPYSAEQKAFIAMHCSKVTIDELVMLFNKAFQENRTKKGLQYFMQANGLHCIPKSIGGKTVFTAEQEKFLSENASAMSRAELTEKLNQQFGVSINYHTVKGWCTKHKIASPNGNGRFTSESSPRWQKGLSKEAFRSHYSEKSFQNMISPMKASNIKHHIGDEVVWHGIPYIVVNEVFGQGFHARLKQKSFIVWEQRYGKIPKEHMMIHLDGNPMNCTIENLRCVPTKYRAFLVHNDWWNADSAVKEIALKWCELYYAINEVEI